MMTFKKSIHIFILMSGMGNGLRDTWHQVTTRGAMGVMYAESSVNTSPVTLPREPEPLSTPEQPRHRGRTRNTAVTHPEADKTRIWGVWQCSTFHTWRAAGSFKDMWCKGPTVQIPLPLVKSMWTSASRKQLWHQLYYTDTEIEINAMTHDCFVCPTVAIRNGPILNYTYFIHGSINSNMPIQIGMDELHK